MHERSIFMDALEVSDPQEREVLLRRACDGDEHLLARVEALLRRDQATGGLMLDRIPDCDLAATVDLPPHVEGPGTSIGPYKLLEQIGEGGMGTVFMAEQGKPVRRKVALKITKAGMDTKQVIARFEAERQALAMMDHPNIAKVFDGGTTDSGRPYFVMELVRGIPITDYCDRVQLSIPERLELFVLVCRAVQHAHQKGIIHRDLKPSNVLVTVIDGAPVPKIIDFGIAKATGGQLTDRTLFTGFAQMIGTPLYMSPEQADLAGVDVDTRSDIYALGVLLYELLTGSTPFDRETFRTAAFDEMRRMIREDEPPTPSTRLSSLGETLTTVSAKRSSDPRHLNRTVRGELDWIAMKALEKDRRRRYETANDFAADVIRYLTDQPVDACPPSASYRFMKFSRRNRGGLMAAGLVTLALIAGTAVSVWQAFRAMRAERFASQGLREVSKANAATTRALRQSEEEVRKSEVVKDFLVDAFRKPDPSQDGRELKVVDLLDRAGAQLDDKFGGDPKFRGELLDALGHTYFGLGLYDRAVSIQKHALSVRESTFGADHRETLASRHDLAVAYGAAGRTGEAIQLEEGTRRSCESIFGPDDKLTLTSTHSLAGYYLETGRTTEAIALFERTLARSESALGPDDSDTISSRVSVAKAYQAVGRIAEAIPMFEQAMKRFEAKLGPAHMKTLRCQNCLAVAYGAAGRSAEAIPLLERAIHDAEAKAGPDHPLSLTMRNNLAAAYSDTGRVADAVRLHEKTLAMRKAALGPAHPDILQSQNNLAATYIEAGRADKAIELLEQALKTCDSTFKPDDQRTWMIRGNRASAYLAARRWAEAEKHYLDQLVWRRREKRVSPRHVASGLAGLGRCLFEQGRAAEAEPLLRECLAIRENAMPDDWSRFDGMALLGGCLLADKRFAEAEPLLIQGYEGLKAREAKVPNRARADLAEAARWIVRLYENWGKPESAAEWRRKLGTDAVPPAESVHVKNPDLTEKALLTEKKPQSTLEDRVTPK